MTQEPPIYPPNPHISRAPQLDDETASAVLTYRLLANHWRTAECCIVENQTKLDGRNYSGLNAAGAYDLDAQKDAIVSYCGSEFFPSELLQNRFIRVPRGAGRSGAADSKRRLREMEQKENENKGTEEKPGGGQGDANAEGEPFVVKSCAFHRELFSRITRMLLLFSFENIRAFFRIRTQLRV